jgi:S2P endopeptidase
MTLLKTLGGVTLFWAVLFLADQALRRYRPWKSSYLKGLENCGISFSFAHVRCYTTKFNRLFYVLGNGSKWVCSGWFALGSLAGVLLMFMSVAILILTLYQTLTLSDSSQQVLTPIMPGVNLPWSEIAHYLLTLILCGVFHEVGHALAATTEQVRVNGFGIFILFLYPGAFVDLHSDHLAVISPKRQLKIYCAGVWHNVILVAGAICVMWVMPYMLAPLYTTGLGAVVTSVHQDSVLAGKLEGGSIITRINGCPVLSTGEWEECVEMVSLTPQTGYCVAEEMMHSKKSFMENQTVLAEDGTHECCSSKDSLSDICFHVFFTQPRQSVYKCLTARIVSARKMCSNSRDCIKMKEHACVFPAISNPSKLVRITHNKGKDVLFLGDPRILRFILDTSAYSPNFPSLPLWLPNLLQTLCNYVTSLSSALALLNMVPAYFLDGQWALTVLVDLLLEKRVPDSNHRNVICNCILTGGTLLLVLNLCLALWTLINW